MKDIWLSPRRIDTLAVDESMIVGPCRPSAVSAEFVRFKPMKFTQRMVFVVDPKSTECVKMFLVTRTA